MADLLLPDEVAPEPWSQTREFLEARPPASIPLLEALVSGREIEPSAFPFPSELEGLVLALIALETDDVVGLSAQIALPPPPEGSEVLRLAVLAELSRALGDPWGHLHALERLLDGGDLDPRLESALGRRANSLRIHLGFRPPDERDDAESTDTSEWQQAWATIRSHRSEEGEDASMWLEFAMRSLLRQQRLSEGTRAASEVVARIVSEFRAIAADFLARSAPRVALGELAPTTHASEIAYLALEGIRVRPALPAGTSAALREDYRRLCLLEVLKARCAADELTVVQNLMKAVDARIAASEPRFGSFDAEPVYPVDRLLAHLDDQEAAVTLFVSDARCFSLVARLGELRVVEIASREEIDRLVDRYVSLLSMLGEMDLYHARQELADVGDSLYRATLDPTGVLEDVDTLILVAEGPLLRLPYQAMLTAPAPTDMSDFGRFPWLVNRMAVSHASSLGGRFGASVPPPARPRHYLGVHCPPVPEESGLAALERCPDTILDELLPTLVQWWGVETYFDENARFDHLESASGVRTIHLTTHSSTLDGRRQLLFAPEVATEPRWVTTDDVRRLDLTGSAVALSACNGWSPVESEDLDSFAQAFLDAGATLVLSSALPLELDASVSLVRSFLTRVRDGEDPGAALRHAQRTFLESAPRARRHPLYWAGMSVLFNAR